MLGKAFSAAACIALQPCSNIISLFNRMAAESIRCHLLHGASKQYLLSSVLSDFQPLNSLTSNR